MNADQYLKDRGPAPGSSSYYALRVSRQPLRGLALYALLHELFAIEGISDDSVAHAKLAWWRSELTRLEAGNPSHPLAQILVAQGYVGGSCVEALLGLTGAIETRLAQSRFLDEVALAAHLSQIGSDPAEAFARANGIIEDASVLACRRIGAGIALARLIMNVGLDAKQKRIFLPHSVLKQHGAPAADILSGKSTPALCAAAQSQSDRAREEIRIGLSQLTRFDRTSLRSLIVLAALTLARLNEVAADGYQVAAHRIALTPLRKLFIAWRTAYFG